MPGGLNNIVLRQHSIENTVMTAENYSLLVTTMNEGRQCDGRAGGRTVQIEAGFPAGVVGHYARQRHSQNGSCVRTCAVDTTLTQLFTLTTTHASTLHHYINAPTKITCYYAQTDGEVSHAYSDVLIICNTGTTSSIHHTAQLSSAQLTPIGPARRFAAGRVSLTGKGMSVSGKGE